MSIKSHRRLESLLKDGWEISQKDSDAISKATASRKARKNLEAINGSLSTLNDTNKNLSLKIETLLLENTRIMVAGIGDLKAAILNPKNWEFDVRRNKKGFISKVFAKQVD